MANDKTGISWTDATWSPVLGCSKVSAGCKHCYAMGTAWRMSHNPTTKGAFDGLARKGKSGRAEWTGEVRFLPERLDRVVIWTKPRRIFVNSMSDLFHEGITNAQIAAVFGAMAAAPQHTFQILTKRPERMLEWMNQVGGGDAFLAVEYCLFEARRAMPAITKTVERQIVTAPQVWPLPNVILGTSIENASTLDRLDILRKTPAALRFVSAEPLLGPLEELDLTGIDQVVVGGESGPDARPMHPEWAREIRDQCIAQGVAFHFKQWGNWRPAQHGEIRRASRVMDITGREKALSEAFDPHTGDVIMVRFGKKKEAGNLLDGRTWEEDAAASRRAA